MKNTVFFTLVLSIFVSCAHKNTVSAPSQPVLSVETQKKHTEMSKTRAIFHVIEPLGIELILLNVKNQKEETVLMDKTLSQLELAPGHWQVTGFILGGKQYSIMNASKQFVFQLKKDKITYVGSYIFQCPKVNQTHLKEMKMMNFFNRYPFKSKNHLCELVVGSDFDKVNQVWMSMDKSKHRALGLGF